MPKPMLNFVWVGPPKFNQGGQDVVGVESIAQNLKTYPPDDPNPMTFWCQGDHKEAYETYFESKGIPITVSSIDDELAARAINPEISEDERVQARRVDTHYKTMMAEPRGQPLDFVFMKDMFFDYILATRGGYVLDTNVQASPSTKVNFEAYPDFKFPLLKVGRVTAQEVWVQYAPPSNPKAKACLSAYLRLYELLEEEIKFQRYSEKHHHMIGFVVLGALNHHSSLTEQSQGISLISPCSTWASTSPDSVFANVPALGVFKEYYNSHRRSRHLAYSSAHLHASMGDVDKLRSDLDHGIDPNLSANPSKSVEKVIDYDAEGETLLHTALRFGQSPGHLACVELLLERGAQPNQVFTLIYVTPTGKSVTCTESPLSCAIKSKNKDAVALLLRWGADPNASIRSPDGVQRVVKDLKTSPECHELLAKWGQREMPAASPDAVAHFVDVKERLTSEKRGRSPEPSTRDEDTPS